MTNPSLSLPEWISVGLNLLTVLVLPLIYYIWRTVTEIRRNEIVHLEESIAELRRDLADRLVRIERTLDRHLEGHQSTKR